MLINKNLLLLFKKNVKNPFITNEVKEVEEKDKTEKINNTINNKINNKKNNKINNKKEIQIKNLFSNLNFKSKLNLKNDKLNKINYLSLLGKIYYINMDNRTDRKKYVENHLNQLWIPYERFSAFAPDLNNFDKLKEEYPQINFGFINRRFKNNSWTKGTIGCFMSHYLLMKKIYQEESEEPKKYYLILEDDCIPTLEHLKGALEFAEHFPDLDILRINSFLKEIQQNSINGWKINYNHNLLSTENKEKNLIKFDGGTHFVMIKYTSIPKILNFLEKHELFFIDGMYNTRELNSYWYQYGTNIIYNSVSSIKTDFDRSKKMAKILINKKFRN
jgi:GR25 family glycosyltransferase involved in LPS biosynthesis